jgi:hypothetical protein
MMARLKVNENTTIRLVASISRCSPSQAGIVEPRASFSMTNLLVSSIKLQLLHDNLNNTQPWIRCGIKRLGCPIGSWNLGR